MANKSVVTQSKLLDFYNSKVKPYLGGGLVLTELYYGNAPTVLNTDQITSTSNTVALSDSIENYKLLLIQFEMTTNGGNDRVFSMLFDINIIKNNYQKGILQVTGTSSASFPMSVCCGFYDSTHFADCYFDKYTTLNIGKVRIIGIS